MLHKCKTCIRLSHVLGPCHRGKNSLETFHEQSGAAAISKSRLEDEGSSKPAAASYSLPFSVFPGISCQAFMMLLSVVETGNIQYVNGQNDPAELIQPTCVAHVATA